MAFLPISREDMKAQGIEQLDFVFVIGDAYVDHPSFGRNNQQGLAVLWLHSWNNIPAGLEG